MIGNSFYRNNCGQSERSLRNLVFWDVTLSLGEWFLMFWKIIVSSSSGVKQSKKKFLLGCLTLTQHHITEVTSHQWHCCKNLTCCEASIVCNTVQAVNKTLSSHYFISEHLVLLEDGTLVITSATLNTTGIYTCIAENAKGNDQRHFLVEVLGKYWAPRKQTHQFITLICWEPGYSDCAVCWMSREV